MSDAKIAIWRKITVEQENAIPPSPLCIQDEDREECDYIITHVQIFGEGRMEYFSSSLRLEDGIDEGHLFEQIQTIFKVIVKKTDIFDGLTEDDQVTVITTCLTVPTSEIVLECVTNYKDRKATCKFDSFI